MAYRANWEQNAKVNEEEFSEIHCVVGTPQRRELGPCLIAINERWTGGVFENLSMDDVMLREAFDGGAGSVAIEGSAFE